MHVLKPRTNRNVNQEKNIQNVLTNTQKIFIYIYIEAPFKKNGEDNYAQDEAPEKKKTE